MEEKKHLQVQAFYQMLEEREKLTLFNGGKLNPYYCPVSNGKEKKKGGHHFPFPGGSDIFIHIAVSPFPGNVRGIFFLWYRGGKEDGSPTSRTEHPAGSDKFSFLRGEKEVSRKWALPGEGEKEPYSFISRGKEGARSSPSPKRPIRGDQTILKGLAPLLLLYRAREESLST